MNRRRAVIGAPIKVWFEEPEAGVDTVTEPLDPGLLRCQRVNWPSPGPSRLGASGPRRSRALVVTAG